MRRKRVLCPEALRRVPAQFSWIDQRLVREHYIERCDVHALALYLFLVTVADHQGLSYYGDATLARSLSMEVARLHAARAALIGAGLIAYAAPLYQVLSLDPPLLPSPPRGNNGLQTVGAVLKRLQAQLKEPAA